MLEAQLGLASAHAIEFKTVSVGVWGSAQVDDSELFLEAYGRFNSGDSEREALVTLSDVAGANHRSHCYYRWPLLHRQTPTSAASTTSATEIFAVSPGAAVLQVHVHWRIRQAVTTRQVVRRQAAHA